MCLPPLASTARTAPGGSGKTPGSRKHPQAKISISSPTSWGRRASSIHIWGGRPLSQKMGQAPCSRRASDRRCWLAAMARCWCRPRHRGQSHQVWYSSSASCPHHLQHDRPTRPHSKMRADGQQAPTIAHLRPPLPSGLPAHLFSDRLAAIIHTPAWAPRPCRRSAASAQAPRATVAEKRPTNC